MNDLYPPTPPLDSAEHRAFRDTVRRFVADEVAPHHAQWERDGQVPRSLWRRAGDLGLLCLTMPEAYGGAGADFGFAAIVVEEMARAGATGPLFYLHTDIVAPYLVHYGSEAQKRHWLPRMARGETIGAIGMTEPGAGSDLASIRTRAELHGEHWRIDGQKIFISNGQIADLLLLAASTDPARGAHGVSLLLVDTDRPGFTRGRRLDKLGMHAQDTSELFFDGLRVPADHLLGEAGAGGVLLAPMMGKVVAVKASPGATVAAGQTVIVLESMKMELHVTAPFDGAVVTIRCAVGDMVERHQPLAEVEPAAEAS